MTGLEFFNHAKNWTIDDIRFGLSVIYNKYANEQLAILLDDYHLMLSLPYLSGLELTGYFNLCRDKTLKEELHKIWANTLRNTSTPVDLSEFM